MRLALRIHRRFLIDSSIMSTDIDRRQLAREAKAIVALALRNGPIEDIHAGRPCPTCPGAQDIYGSLTFCVSASGIYFAGSPDPVSRTAPLKLYRFADGKTVELGHFDKPMWTNISVSPDQKWLLYEQIDSSVHDLMLVENFR